MSDDCPCRPIPAVGDARGAVTAITGAAGVGSPPRRRRPKQYSGGFCVVSKKSGKVFNCTHTRESADRLAARLGDRFEVVGGGKRSR